MIEKLSEIRDELESTLMHMERLEAVLLSDMEPDRDVNLSLSALDYSINRVNRSCIAIDTVLEVLNDVQK